MALQTILLTIGLLVFRGTSLGSSLRIDVSPNDISTIEPSAVNISCMPSDPEVQEILVLEVRTMDSIPLAVLRNNPEMIYGSKSHEEILTSGHIDKMVNQSYLTLTLLNPTVKDAGSFQCVMYYLSDAGVLKDKKSEANLTFHAPTIQSVVDYFRHKISKMETSYKKQTKTCLDREDDLIHRVSNLEKQLQVQMSKVIDLEEVQREQDANLSGQMSNLEDNVKAGTSKIVNLETEVGRHKLGENQMKEDISGLEKVLQRQTAMETNYNYTSAFLARYKSGWPENVGDTIVFNEVMTQVGQGYDETTGVFTAPISGVYSFHLTALTWKASGMINLALMTDGSRVADLVASYASGYNDQSSISVFVRLSTGGKVKVVMRQKSPNIVLQPGQATLFTGYLHKVIL